MEGVPSGAVYLECLFPKMGGSLNTVAACENSVMANFAEFLFHALR